MKLKNLLGATALILCLPAPAFAGTGTFTGNSDDFSVTEDWDGYNASGTCEYDTYVFGTWQAQFDGGGCTTVTTSPNALQINPQTTTSSGSSYGNLVTNTLEQGDPNSGGDIYLDVKLKTLQQLRSGGAGSPNSWEVGWVLWNVSYDSSCSSWVFDYFIPKTTGYELGMIHCVSGTRTQTYLATGTGSFPINNQYEVEVYHHAGTTPDGPGDNVDVYVNGTQYVHYTGGNGTPIRNGFALGLYCEDSKVQYTYAYFTRL